MTPERWRQTEALYHAASERDDGDRPRFLDEACILRQRSEHSDLRLRGSLSSRSMAELGASVPLRDINAFGTQIGSRVAQLTIHTESDGCGHERDSTDGLAPTPISTTSQIPMFVLPPRRSCRRQAAVNLLEEALQNAYRTRSS